MPSEAHFAEPLIHRRNTGWSSRPSSRREPLISLDLLRWPPLTWGVALLLALSVVLGGGARQGLWSDAILQIYSLVLITAFVAAGRRPLGLRRLPVVLLIGLVGLPLLQLVPMPPALWTLLPQRAQIAADLGVAGVALPWMPISLTPERTWRAALSLLPAIATVLAVSALDRRSRRAVSVLVVALGMISVLIGLAQLAQGPGSALRFHPMAAQSVGFFANRNHYAALLCCAIPITAAWLAVAVLDRRPERLFVVSISVVVYASLLVGLAAAQSRAGIFLGLLAGIGSLGLALVHGRRFARFGAVVIGGAWLLGLGLIVQYAVLGFLDRFGPDLFDDFRLAIAGVTVRAVAAFLPVGSGIGTFDGVYRIFETPDVLLESYVNHAHNEWLELALEGGVPAIVLLLLFLAWFGAASIRIWRRTDAGASPIDLAIARAASIVVTLLALHSAVDYPLRTTALMVVFAWACVILADPLGPADASRDGRGERRHRHRRRVGGQESATPSDTDQLPRDGVAIRSTARSS